MSPASPRAQRTALIVHKGDHSLGYYSLPEGIEFSRVPIDRYPHEMALTPDGTLVLIAHFGVALAEDEGDGGHTVSVVDVAKRECIAIIDCGAFRRPHGIACDQRGRAFILSEGSSRLLVSEDPRSGRIDRSQPTGGAGSHMLTVSRDGRRAYCSNMRSDTVTVLDLQEPSQPPIAIGVGARPEGSVLDQAEETLFVVNRESADITVIDVAASRVRSRIATGPGPVRLCWNDSGLLLVALYHARQLALVDPQSGVVQDRLDLPGAPISVAWDDATRMAYLSTLQQEVLSVDVSSFRLAGRFATRADPDPIAVLA